MGSLKRKTKVATMEATAKIEATTIAMISVRCPCHKDGLVEAITVGPRANVS